MDIQENKPEYWHQRYIKMSMEVTKLSSELSNIRFKLHQIRNNPASWRIGEAGGQDSYAGMPSFLRVIDEIIDQK